MTPSEKQALLQFMGVTYGQAVKTDKDIVNHSAHLRPVSEQIKQQFAQVMAIPTTEQQYNVSPPTLPPAVPEPVQPVIVSENGYVDNMQYIEAKSVLPSNIISTTVIPTTQTYSTSSELISVLTDIKVALENIASILDKQITANVKTTKPKIKEQG